MTELRRYLDPDEHPQQAKRKQALIFGQMGALTLVGFFFLVWAVVEIFWPSFFSPFEWSRGTALLADSVLAFWPLYVYAAALAIVSLLNLLPSLLTGTSDEGHLIYDSTSSVLAGIWEELGFRCVFILFAMISIMFANYFWAWLAGMLILGAAIFFVLVMLHDERSRDSESDARNFRIGLGVLAVSALPLLYFTQGLGDPVYWFCENVVFKVLSLVSFGALDSIVHYPVAPPLFIMGAISANAKFRDGHKYQGPIGYLNSWIVGFVFLYAMLYHGLWTAIIVHAVYDLEFAAIRYLGRKVDRLEEG